MTRRNGVFGLIHGFFNMLSVAIFVVPAMVVAGAVLWLCITSLLGINKADGADYRVTDEDCGIAGVATGHVVRSVNRNKGVETAGPTTCSRQYQPGHFSKVSYDKSFTCSADGTGGTLQKIPTPDSWGFNRPQLEVCSVVLLMKP